MHDHTQSAQGKSRGQSRIGPCPALIARDRAWYHTWNSVLFAANLEDGSFFFVQGSRSTMSWKKNVEKSGLETTAPNRLADRKHCALSTQPSFVLLTCRDQNYSMRGRYWYTVKQEIFVRNLISSLSSKQFFLTELNSWLNFPQNDKCGIRNSHECEDKR